MLRKEFAENYRLHTTTSGQTLLEIGCDARAFLGEHLFATFKNRDDAKIAIDTIEEILNLATNFVDEVVVRTFYFYDENGKLQPKSGVTREQHDFQLDKICKEWRSKTELPF